MTKSKAALVLTSLLLASCSGSGTLVSISEHGTGQMVKTDYLNWNTGFRRWSYPRRENSTASGFVWNFARYAESLPFPIVTWAADGARSMSPFEYPDHQPYAEAFRRIGHWAGPYQAKLYPGFVEVAWADADSEKAIRGSMQEWVPPIAFQSRNAADFLIMWHTVSGIEFKYDPGLVENSNSYDRERLLEDSDPDLPLMELPHRPFPLGFSQFISSEKQAIDDFMPVLAAHVGGLARKTLRGWVIEKFQRNKQGLQLIENCLSLIKNDPFFGARDPVEILSRIGEPALPELVREYRQIKGGRDINNKQVDQDLERRNSWLEDRLIAILFRIHSQERDEALLTALRNGNYYIPDGIIRALAASDCRSAVPVIEKIANTSDISPETRITARVALNALGGPPAREKDVEAIPTVRQALETEKGNQAMTLLRAVLNQCDQYKTGMQLQSVDLDSLNTMVLWGYYAERPNMKPPPSWTFEVPVMREDRALVRFSFSCGPSCSESYLGRLKKQSGRWVVTRWWRLWIS